MGSLDHSSTYSIPDSHINQGANVNAQNTSGSSALHYACYIDNLNEDSVKVNFAHPRCGATQTTNQACTLSRVGARTHMHILTCACPHSMLTHRQHAEGYPHRYTHNIHVNTHKYTDLCSCMPTSILQYVIHPPPPLHPTPPNPQSHTDMVKALLEAGASPTLLEEWSAGNI